MDAKTIQPLMLILSTTLIEEEKLDILLDSINETEVSLSLSYSKERDSNGWY